ncbi:MAG: SufS family cysteine desulfurase [Salinibacterium sp.]|nr:SufS family cysteine desulfurase [Salinibacterium sp.]
MRSSSVTTTQAGALVTALTDAEITAIREDFPILRAQVNGHPLVYLDSAATSQKPLVVLDAERDFSLNRNSAVHRGAHTLAAEATEEFEDARTTVARFVGVDADEIVWTSNATEGLNLIAYSVGNAAHSGQDTLRLRPGDEIVVTEQEHHANLIPWQQLALRTGATLRFVPVDDEGALQLDLLEHIITDRTRLVAFTHVSNVLGTINPVDLIVARARAVGALTVLDACQSAPHLPLDLHALDVDFAVFSGHKLLAPTGIGVLYGRRELLNALPPFITGGSMITTVTMEKAEFLPAPQRFEAGTQRVSQAIALAAAIDYLGGIGMDRVAEHGRKVSRRLMDGLAAIDGVKVFGAAGDRVGLASIDVAGIHAHDVGQFLDDRGIAVRVGHHCTQPLHRRLGLTATVRASGSVYTTDAEIDLFLQAVTDARTYFGVAS